MPAARARADAGSLSHARGDTRADAHRSGDSRSGIRELAGRAANAGRLALCLPADRNARGVRNRPHADTVELIIRCDLTTRRVGIARSGRASGQVEMLIRTETQDRTLTATPVNAAAPLLTVELSANDRLLDAIAFSKGRFAVETPGTNGLYAPAYPEITRVMEDCRG